MQHTITIQETMHGLIVDLPYLSKDQLGLLIQSASNALRDHEIRDQKAAQGQRLMGNVLEEQKAEPMHQFATGAVRSEEIKARYDLIPSGPLERLALRYGLGAAKYGEYNWQKGMPFSDTFNHIIDHLESVKRKYEQGFAFDFIDDDLAGAAWGCFTLMFFGARGDYTPGTKAQLLGIDKHPVWDRNETREDAQERERAHSNIAEKVKEIARVSLNKMRAQEAQLSPEELAKWRRHQEQEKLKNKVTFSDTPDPRD